MNRIYHVDIHNNSDVGKMFEQKQSVLSSQSKKDHKRAAYSAHIVPATLQVLKNYCKETSIHGCKFITENQGSPWRSSLWLIICLTGLTLCCILMQLTWSRYLNTPTITGIENTNYAIWEVEFPAITICNYNKVYAPAANILAEKLMEFGFDKTDVMEFFKATISLIDYRRQIDSAININITNTFFNLGYTMDKLMLALAQPCDKLIRDCLWLGHPCLNNIKQIKAEGGYCCSFNSNVTSFSSLKVLNDSNAMNTTYNTLRMPGAGKRIRLYMQLAVEPDYYVASTKPIYGAEVLVHSPVNFPDVSTVSTTVQPGQIAAAIVVPSIIESSNDVRSIPLNLRQCVFDDEDKLQSIEHYSYENCIVDCRVQEMIDICGCIPFFYTQRDNVRFCNVSDTHCLKFNRHMFYSFFRSQNAKLIMVTSPTSIDKVYNHGYSLGLDMLKCECYPQCSQTDYDLTSQVAKMTSDNIFVSPYANYNDNVKFYKQNTLLDIYYRDLTCTKYIRNRIMSWNDLIANYGGIFGLCLGGSVISVFEFFFLLYSSIFLSNKSTLQTRNEPKNKTAKITNRPNKELYWNELIPGKHQSKFNPHFLY